MTDHYMAGDLRLTTGGLYVGGSADANKLDDYEEGTWTPSIQASGTHYSSVTYTVQLGYYTKVGRLVTAHFRVQISAYTIGSATGNINIESLPFTNTNNQNCASAIDYASNINYDLSSFNPIHVGINVKPNTVEGRSYKNKKQWYSRWSSCISFRFSSRYSRSINNNKGDNTWQ
jgi:hypothetical protein